MTFRLKDSPLFYDMSQEETDACLICSKAKFLDFQKDEMIFTADNEPKSVFVLLEGDVLIYKVTISGKRDIFMHVDKPGDVFGEVYLFMKKSRYEYYSVTLKQSKVIEIPQDYFYYTCEKSCSHHVKLIRNMMSILARKAYLFNLKLQILASGTLRQKIIRYLIENLEGNSVRMTMNREMFADYLNVARPSLSRELMNMEEEGLITIKGKTIEIPNPNILDEGL
ncbi:MAG TPA: Crp/Fnr family transcriptional regulator [Clostridia bacterium]|nr:MAG: Fumarate and nitrate reduction regulatory protein [Firmicutes bacterium ADurb.Bin146]HOD92617.1 Crp/Fnr family transcriptional regulator [Clostridia bacterium]HQM39469.1 Crp/Fnr family transcriptional regulator [Clostridia bacterium]